LLSINVQNQGNGFLSATEFAASIVDPVTNMLTQGIDVQEGALNKPTGDRRHRGTRRVFRRSRTERRQG
jgi:hypothetical protein